MKPLRKRELAAYAGVAAPLSALGLPVSVYLPTFYADNMGLGLAVTGLVFTLARVWDVITDPIMGIASDRLQTRWGRRKPWLAIAAPVLMVGGYFIFLPPGDTASGLYLAFWLFFAYIGYTMLHIAHQSWGSELATSYDERSRLFGWREFSLIGGMLGVLALPAIIDLQGGDRRDQIAAMGWFIVLAIPGATALALWLVPKEPPPLAKNEPVSWAMAKEVLGRDLIFWRLIAGEFFTSFAYGVAGALYIAFATWSYELPDQTTYALFAFFVTGFVSLPIWVQLAYRIGKDRSLMLSMFWGASCMLLLPWFIEPGNATQLWLFTVFFGVSLGAGSPLFRSLLADLTDIDELETGQRRPGVYYALLNSGAKLGGALSVGASFTILSLVYGFQIDGDNTPEAAAGVLDVFAYGTALGLLLAAAMLWRYPITRERQQAVRDALAQRALAAQQDEPGSSAGSSGQGPGSI